MGKTSTGTLFTLAGIMLAAVIARVAFKGNQTQGQVAKKLAPTHSVTLNWKIVPGATFYYVYRSTVSGSQYQKIGTSPGPTFKDTPVASGAVFYYVVTAVVDGRESKYSNETKAAVP
jgi:fibronectin type 3 domain-containing protein